MHGVWLAIHHLTPALECLSAYTAHVIGRKRVAGLFSLFVLFLCCYMQSGTVQPVVTHQSLDTTGECVVQQNLAE